MNYNDYQPAKKRGKPLSNLKQHKKDKKKFLIDIRINDKRYRKTFKVLQDSQENMIDSAIRELDKFILLKNSEVCGDVSAMHLNGYFERYIDAKSKSAKWSSKYKQDTIRAYNLYIKDVIGKKKVTSIKPSDITSVMNKVAHLSLRTQKLVLDILNPLFKQALHEDVIISTSPIKESHRVTRDIHKEKKIVTDAVHKYKLVHNTIHSLFKDSSYYRTLMLFGFYGRRKGEVLSLQWKDINIKNKSYTVRATNSKVGTAMAFTLADDLIEALKQLKKEVNHADNDYLFESPIKAGVHLKDIETPVVKLRKATGIDELTFHWLRNLAVSALSSAGVEAIHLSAMLGHTDVNTVNKYLSLQREKSTQQTIQVSDTILKHV